MAPKRLQYWEKPNLDHYREGPFVMVQSQGASLGLTGTWHIEMKTPEGIPRAFPTGKYWDWIVDATEDYQSRDEAFIAQCVDTLNKRYRMEALDELT